MPNVKIPSKRCATCIYHPGNEDLLALVMERTRDGGHQLCHTFQVKGDHRYTEDGKDMDVWCRGFYENEVDPRTKALIESIPGLVEVIPISDGNYYEEPKRRKGGKG